MYGSLQNRLMEGRQTQEPYVGMGATKVLYSDRRAYTVSRIKSKCRIIVQRDRVIREPDYNYFGNQHCRFEPNPEGYEVELIRTKKGWKVLGGSTYFTLGVRDEYEDPSF